MSTRAWLLALALASGCHRRVTTAGDPVAPDEVNLEAPAWMSVVPCVDGEPIIISTSPDGENAIEVTSHRPFWDRFIPRGPGGGSDVPGYARLIRTRDHVVQRYAYVDLLSGLAPSDVHWTDTCVRVGIVAIWSRSPGERCF